MRSPAQKGCPAIAVECLTYPCWPMFYGAKNVEQGASSVCVGQSTFKNRAGALFYEVPAEFPE